MAIDLENGPFGEVLRILVERIVATKDVDERQDDLVGCVVYVHGHPADTLVTTAEVDFIEDLIVN